MEIGKLIRFHDEQFFDGAVQLRWVLTHEEKARQAAQSFVFHGPRYHAADPTENDGIESGYRLTIMNGSSPPNMKAHAKWPIQ
jgi:hypothetical protein